MVRMKLFRALYFVGMALIFLGGYRLYKELSFGEILFSAGVVLYTFVQLILLFQQPLKLWRVFEYMKAGVNLMFLLSIAILMVGESPYWYYPFLIGLLMDFFANIFRKIQKQS